MQSIDNSQVLNYDTQGKNILNAVIGFVYNSGANTITVTDTTTYPTGDARKLVEVDVFDRYGGKVSGKILVGTTGGAVAISVAALNPARGFAMNVRVVSNLGMYKDGSVFNIANTFNAGPVTMEK